MSKLTKMGPTWGGLHHGLARKQTCTSMQKQLKAAYNEKVVLVWHTCMGELIYFIFY